jgi:TPP-dependent pyruvate/acetoin dehydrogenase alpha subunit
MVLVRALKEKLNELYQPKAMFGSTHSYRGQGNRGRGLCGVQSIDLVARHIVVRGI